MPKHKIIVKGFEARTRLKAGADLLADCVKSTFGPHGVNFIIEKGNRITNDGKTVASEIDSKDEIMQRGISVIREAAINTDREVGDATTTACILAQAILEEASRFMPTDTVPFGKKTPGEVIAQIERERKEITEKLIAMAENIESEEALIASALVSSENQELAQLIGKMQWDLGKEGYIICEEVAHPTSSIERVRGVRIDNGLSAPIVINNQEKGSLEVKDVSVILTNHVILKLAPMQKPVEQLERMGVKKLVIVARAFSEEAIRTCMEMTKAGFSVFPVNAPYVDQVEIMKDLAAVLGARFLNTEDSELSHLLVTDIGFAERVEARRWDAIFTGKDDDKTKERVEARLKELQEKLIGEPSAFEKKNITARIAQLSNGFALLKVGSPSETNRKRLYDKAEDAVSAVRAAFQEGVVPGAGLAFKTIADGLPDSYMLKRPLYALSEQIKKTTPIDFVVEEWVKDPVKVLRVALEKASYAASVLATAGGAIAWEEEKPKYVQEAAQTTETIN